jgi:2-polyprenyl-6-hydroxyphenyl methylase/3-demethylubiquinone-9 3-methyltransferase
VLGKKDILRLYADASFGTRLYIAIKLRICPLLEVEVYFPKRGKVLDLGCGNGFFSSLLKLGSPARTVIGLDLDARKIAQARLLEKRLEGLSFGEGDIAEAAYPGPVDMVSLIDVLYLIPFDVQERILRRAYDALRPGGRLFLKDMDTRPRWKYAWNYFQETVSVRIVGFTLGSRFYFRSRGDYARLLESIGFKVEAVPLDRRQIHPHILFLGEK